jgi:DNA invertase Pin-like site-specific DNA recombinase
LKTRYKEHQPVLAQLPTSSQLPINRPIAIYYRQSTDAQIGNISTSIQTIDMVEYLKRCGWAEKNITMIDMDAGISGSTKIDERPGMSALFDLITAGKVGAVACQDEDRLFRDVTQIQVNIFIEACRAAQVLVLTPSMVYDFASELTGVFHARQFRFKSEMAAEYINSVIRGRLHRAKRRMLMNGQWGGAGIPPGYMVDMRKKLPEGSTNEHWRKFVVFEPYAEVIREYFRLFLAFAGSTRTTVRHIHKHGPYFPDPQQCVPPEGFKFVSRIRRFNGRYCPGRTGLVGILTNAQYIGHWLVNGSIVRWNNHPPIVDESTFMQAFNYLSSISLDGKTNHDYRGIQEHARPSKDEQRPVERPLCAGMIGSYDTGEWSNVGTYWVEPLQHYTYTLWSNKDDKYVWSKAAPFVDDAITRMLQAKLVLTFNQDVWEEAVITFSEQFEKQRVQKQAQLRNLIKVMENLVAGLETLTNQAMILATQERYEKAQEEYDRLSAELAAIQNDAEQMQRVYDLRESCGPVLENWDNMTRDEKRVVLQAFIHTIEASAMPAHALRLTVYWKDGTSDEMVLPRQATTGTCWLPEETQELLRLVESGASQIEIAQTFPERKWKAIRLRYWRETGSGAELTFRPKPIKDEESFLDYLERTGQSFGDGGSAACSETKHRGVIRRFRQGAARPHRQPTRHN